MKNIHERYNRQVTLAQTYAFDGAFLTAADKLRTLANDLEKHHADTSPPCVASLVIPELELRLELSNRTGFEMIEDLEGVISAIKKGNIGYLPPRLFDGSGRGGNIHFKTPTPIADY